MKLTGKTRAELDVCLSDKSRFQLIDIIFSLVTFDRLLTAREIAEASHVAKRDVLHAIREGEFVDPIFGRGFFCRSGNSLRVSAGAANAWRRSFFVPVAVPPSKKEAFPSILESAEDERARRKSREIGVYARNAAQKAVRELSPVYLAENGAK